jgi:integrating conjugative element protein (TIGR03752 family)
MKSNAVIKVLAYIVMSISLVIFLGKLSADVQAAEQPLTPFKQGPDKQYNGLSFDPLSDDQLENKYGVDVDSPEETMRTLTRELQTVRENSKKIQEENEKLRKQTTQLLNMESNITERVDGRVKNAEAFVDESKRQLDQQRARSESLISKLETRLKQLEKKATNLSAKPGAASASGYDIGRANIPGGLGYDAFGTEQIIWINPIDAQVDPKKGSIVLPDFDRPLLSKGEQIRKGDKAKEQEFIKAYTIPANATLIGSTSMTALLGRIPVGGNIADPYPFKLIVGAENLSSNGIHIPDVQGITMTGIAKGDWTLSCVSGEIQSMTFTFSDGSISTYPDPEEGSRKKQSIGWFSDKYGIPCVTGQRITNAATYLAAKIGMGAISAYASAQAQAEYTTTANADGGFTTGLTGNVNTAAKNQAISGGIDEVIDWVDKRQSQSFDAVYVAPGTPVHIHINHQIAIDYPVNGHGRKIQHDEFVLFQDTNTVALD